MPSIMLYADPAKNMNDVESLPLRSSQGGKGKK